jgi:Mce-associated membrane protein
VEDQPAAAGDLTGDASEAVPGEPVKELADEPSETEGADGASPATPVRRGGRHRWFRPRPPSTPAASDADKPATAEETAAVEKAKDAQNSSAAESTVEETVDEAAADTADAAQPATAEASAEESPAEVVGETATVAPKPIGRVLTAAVAAAAVVFVGAGAFAGAMLQPYLADKALVDTKLEIARTATTAIATLWTYTPDNMDSLPDRSAKYLAGDFQNQYRKYIDAIAPVNKQAKVTNSTQVVGAAVESLQGKDATAMVYTNTTNTSPQSNNIPSLRYLSYRLTLQRHGSQWLITKMTTITSLDLTPKLG